MNRLHTFLRYAQVGFERVVFLSVLSAMLFLASRKANAACETAFTLDWSNPATYSVSCGNVTPSGWKVSNERCSFFSPLFNVGSSTSGGTKQVDLVLRINQSGNLDTDDSAMVTIYVNGSSNSSYSFAGNNSNSVFSINPLLSVPSNGTYQVIITMFTTASNEFWTIKNGDFTTCVIEPTPLPITLVDFDVAEESDGSALITWVTQSEKINDYFTLERSNTGDVFEPLAKLDGAGTSTEMRYYKFIDHDPLNGVSYYRLSQTDFDGKVTVCGLITFHLQSKHVSQPVIVLRNNPFKDQLSISVNSLDATKVSVRLISSSGKESFDQNVPLQSGKNSLDVPINHELLPGIYTLVVTTDIGDQLVAKAVKR